MSHRGNPENTGYEAAWPAQLTVEMLNGWQQQNGKGNNIEGCFTELNQILNLHLSANADVLVSCVHYGQAFQTGMKTNRYLSK